MLNPCPVRCKEKVVDSPEMLPEVGSVAQKPQPPARPTLGGARAFPSCEQAGVEQAGVEQGCLRLSQMRPQPVLPALWKELKPLIRPTKAVAAR